MGLRQPSQSVGAVAAAALVLLGVAAWPARGETDEQVALLPYLNKAAGFEIGLPDSWSYEHGRFRGPGGAQGLLRVGTLNGRRAVQLFLFTDADAESFDAWLARLAASLRTIDGVIETDTRPAAAVDGRPAGFVLVRGRIDTDLVETAYYCVAFDDATVWALSYGVAQAGAEPAGELAVPPLAMRIAGTLRVFYDAELAARIEEARRRGAAYLRERFGEDLRQMRLDDQPRHYLVEDGGRPLGYARRVMRPSRHSVDDPRYGAGGQPGLRVSTETWRFFDRGVANFVAEELFSSIDGTSDLYQFTTSTTAPADAPVQKPFVTRDECVRAGKRLVSSYTTSRHVVMPEPRAPIELPEDFLGLAWARVLPALMRERPTELVAFTTYDEASRELMTWSIRYAGRRALPVAVAGLGAGDEVDAFELRQGLSDIAALVYTDRFGNVLVEREGPRMLRLVEEEDAERQFGQRRDAARPRLSNAE